MHASPVSPSSERKEEEEEEEGFDHSGEERCKQTGSAKLTFGSAG